LFNFLNIMSKIRIDNSPPKKRGRCFGPVARVIV
jgi:hypothetical protein